MNMDLIFVLIKPAKFIKDKVILVTGASDGIGRVAAKTYATIWCNGFIIRP
jgi:FlaA1/EpsC-like NDP-sugar epimerase